MSQAKQPAAAKQLNKSETKQRGQVSEQSVMAQYFLPILRSAHLQRAIGNQKVGCKTFADIQMKGSNFKSSDDKMFNQNIMSTIKSESSTVIQRYESGEHAQFGETQEQLKEVVDAKKLSYQVKKGDTIEGLSSKFGITAQELKKANRSLLRQFHRKSPSKAANEGFIAGAMITIPPVIGQEVKDALKQKELNFSVNGVQVNYGEGIAMADLFADPSQMAKTSKEKLEHILALIRKERSGQKVSTEEWQTATDGRYLKLAENNEEHFAPTNANLVNVSKQSQTKNHKLEWEKYHQKALELSKSGIRDEALATNSFGDHFLTDAFAGGHLINKRDVMEKFKGNLPTNKKGEPIKNAIVFFDKVAAKSFVGDVQAEFSKYETVEWKGVVFRPNIDSVDRFSKLLQGIYEEEPNLLANAVAKATHDKLNSLAKRDSSPHGMPVVNQMGDNWELSGDGTLNKESLAVGRKAVAQSQMNVLEMFKSTKALNLPAIFKKVWDYVPYPTPDGAKLIKQTVLTGTDPNASDVIDSVTSLIRDNYKIILEELVKRKKLKLA